MASLARSPAPEVTVPLAPTAALSSGHAIPRVGLGTVQENGPAATESVRDAIAAGYRLIDTAAIYGNEAEVGEAVRTCDVAREDLFVTSKLWISDYGRDAARRGFDATMARLGLDHVDLYLLHWPMPDEWDRTLESWRVLEELRAEGRVRDIGVANFRPEDLDRLAAQSATAPVVNQVEMHPYLAQRAVREANERRDVRTQAWSPLGGPRGVGLGVDDAEPDKPRSVLADPVVGEVATSIGASPAQVVLAWHLTHDVLVVPKSSSPERRRANLAAAQLELTDAQVAAIDSLDRGWRGGEDPALVSTATNHGVVDNSVLDG